MYELTKEIEDAFVKVKAFIDNIDKPGAILAVYDEGKTFGGSSDFYRPLYDKMLEYIFKETKYITVRVGGYSNRIDYAVWDMTKDNPEHQKRVEHVGEKLRKMTFDKDSNFIKRVDQYDFKGFAGHTCLWYYINDVESGYTDRDGVFQPFYGAKGKGFDALVDVVMAIGYGDIPPATAAVHTFTSDSTGDRLFCGGKATMKKCRGQSRKDLFEEYGIQYLDIHDFHPYR